MRLGIFTTQFEAKHVANGISNNAYLLSKFLIGKGFDVHVFAPRFKGLKEREEYDHLTIERFDIVPISDISYFSPGFMKKVSRMDFDIIHSFHYGYFPASVGLRVAQKKKIPHILTPTFHKAQMNPLKSFLFSFYNNTEGKNLLKNSFVLPYNNDEKNHLTKISNFRYSTVPSPIQDNVFYPGKKSSKTTILYVGAMLPWKGARIAFDICKKIEKEHDNVQFKFIGEGPLENELKKKAGKNFVFMKNLSLETLAKEYRNSDIFLYPTAYESFGRVAAEAMMSGVPVITTQVGAMPETVGKGGVTVEYGNWEEMETILRDLISNKKRRAKLGSNATKQAQRFRTEQVCNQIFKVYQKLK